MSKGWNSFERKFLRENYDKMTCDEIANELGRSKGGIRNLAKSMNIKIMCKSRMWTDKEKRFLAESSGTKTAREIADLLGMNPKAVRNKAFKMGIKLKLRPSQAKDWKPNDLSYLIENFKKKSTSEICAHLNRSEHSVYKKAQLIGLSNKVGPKRPWTKEEDRYLVNNIGTKTKSRIAKDLNRTRGAVKRRANGLGIKFNPANLTVRELSNIFEHDNIKFNHDELRQWKIAGFKTRRLYNRETFSIAHLRAFIRKRPEAVDVYSLSDETLDLFEIDLDEWPEPPNFKLIWCDKGHYGRLNCFELFDKSCHCNECGLRLKRWANAYTQEFIE